MTWDETVTVPKMALWLCMPPFVLGVVSLYLYVVEPVFSACERVAVRAAHWWGGVWDRILR